MRVILKNLIYRGGNNNPASVQNPLTLNALSDLKESGFNQVVYLYNKNFGKFFNQNLLDSLQSNGLSYVCKPSIDSANTEYILNLIDERVNGRNDSLIYLHCWNGWHQSGWIAGIILMQYCDFSNELAVQYWAMNTDNNYIGYDHVKKALLNYKRNPRYSFTREQKEQYCPCLDKDRIDTLFPLESVVKNKKPKKATANQAGKPEDLMENYPDATGKTSQAVNHDKSKKTTQGNSASARKYHVVAKGDTLTGLAVKYKTTVKKLCEINKLKPNGILKIGQKIKLV